MDDLNIKEARAVAREIFRFISIMSAWATKRQVNEIIHDMSLIATDMQRDADERDEELRSVRMSGRGLRVGDRVRTLFKATDVDVKFGEFGEVAAIDCDTIRVHLEKYHPGLDPIGNCWVYTTDDVINNAAESILDGDDIPSPVLYAREMLEIVDECTHQFAHHNDDLSGNRFCTTCGAVPALTADFMARWKYVDRVEVAVQLEALVLFTPEQYRALWAIVDSLTLYQLAEEQELAVLHCESEMRRMNMWRTADDD